MPRVASVNQAKVRILKMRPPVLEISANGAVMTAGWSNPRLEKHFYLDRPADGIWDFDFIADPPRHGGTEGVFPIQTPAYFERDFEQWRGVRIHAASNNVVVLLDEAGSEPFDAGEDGQRDRISALALESENALTAQIDDLVECLKSEPELIEGAHPDLLEFVADADETRTGDPIDELREHLYAFLSECREHNLLKTKLPKQTKIVGKFPRYKLRCRTAKIRVYIRACHPSIDSVWDDVEDCIRIAIAAAGGAAVVGGGGAAWKAFETAFYACIVGKLGSWAKNIRLSLKSKTEHGKWGKC